MSEELPAVCESLIFYSNASLILIASHFYLFLNLQFKKSDRQLLVIANGSFVIIYNIRMLIYYLLKLILLIQLNN